MHHVLTSFSVPHVRVLAIQLFLLVDYSVVVQCAIRIDDRVCGGALW